MKNPFGISQALARCRFEFNGVWIGYADKISSDRWNWYLWEDGRAHEPLGGCIDIPVLSWGSSADRGSMVNDVVKDWESFEAYRKQRGTFIKGKGI